jgi:hypothetical protein
MPLSSSVDLACQHLDLCLLIYRNSKRSHKARFHEAAHEKFNKDTDSFVTVVNPAKTPNS